MKKKNLKTPQEEAMQLFVPIFGKPHINKLCAKYRKQWNEMTRAERMHYIHYGFKIIQGL